MSEAKQDVKLVVVCADATTRDRCLTSLASLESSGRLKSVLRHHKLLPVEVTTIEKAHEELLDYLAGQASLRAVVLSDLFAEPADRRRGTWEPTSAAKELRQQFADRIATIAVVENHRRVPEVDHTIVRDFQLRDLLNTLKLTTEKLSYLSPPNQQQLQYPIVVRELKTQTEMRDYFKLRYRVYSVMGYLEESLLNARARLEMDWCDTTAIHIGAFDQQPFREKLIGTARVVNAVNPKAVYEDFAAGIAEEDPVLLKTIERTFLSLRLPIFHSARSRRLREIHKEVELFERNCGELSRVIVDKDHRGAGVARLLVKFAVFKANHAKIDPLLLECLEAHVPFYETFGFRRIPGEVNRVLGIERSMVAMEVTPTLSRDLFSGADVFLNSQRLCACKHESCYKGLYDRYGTMRCPIAVADSSYY